MMTTIPAGTIFLVSTDCYSSYSVRAVCRALRDLQPDQLRAEWLAAHPEQAGTYKFSEHEFLTSLVVSGAVEELSAMEWHLGDYREFASIADPRGSGSLCQCVRLTE